MLISSDFEYYFRARSLEEKSPDSFRRFGQDVPPEKTHHHEAILKRMDSIASHGREVFSDQYCRVFWEKERSRFLIDLLPQETDHQGRVAPISLCGVLPNKITDRWIASTIHYAWQFADHAGRTLSNEAQHSGLLGLQRLADTIAIAERNRQLLTLAIAGGVLATAAFLTYSRRRKDF